ncbi:hypothetical protein OH77DRAFT_395481 [Trametes cingulata]|nr:hypothetical protein OH77DRAFT_395481 [Trametes cingulata]
MTPTLHTRQDHVHKNLGTCTSIYVRLQGPHSTSTLRTLTATGAVAGYPDTLDILTSIDQNFDQRSASALRSHRAEARRHLSLSGRQRNGLLRLSQASKSCVCMLGATSDAASRISGHAGRTEVHCGTAADARASTQFQDAQIMRLGALHSAREEQPWIVRPPPDPDVHTHGTHGRGRRTNIGGSRLSHQRIEL